MTRKFHLRILEEDARRLREILLADTPKESAAFLLAGIAEGDDTSTLLVRRIVEIPPSEYRIKEDLYLDVSPRAINGLAALCEANKLGAVLCHSHPFQKGRPGYSPTDDNGERKVSGVLRELLDQKAPIGSLLLSADSQVGRVWLDGGRTAPIEKVVVLGRSIREIGTSGSSEEADKNFDEDVLSRQVQAFGAAGQARISSCKVAIVGTGGTGSPLAEQLVRLGVDDLTLIEPDVLSRSNLSRVYGSQESHFGDKSPPRKVQVVAGHLRSIRPGARVLGIDENVLLPDTAARLLDRDVIFLCTDEHWGRSLVNQIAYQYMIPTINVGFRIDSDKERITGGTGVLHVVRPGRPCLWCYEYLNADVIRAESLPPDEYAKLAKEKYVVGLNSDAPSIISMTTMMASLAVNQFLQLMTDYQGELGDTHSLRYDLLMGDLRRCKTRKKEKCVCGKILACGDLRPLPTCQDEALLQEIAKARR